jgi:hypothetical protein
MNFVGLRISIFHHRLLMRLLNTCAIVNGLVDGWKGMGNGGSRSRSSPTPTEGRGREGVRGGSDGEGVGGVRRNQGGMSHE